MPIDNIIMNIMKGDHSLLGSSLRSHQKKVQAILKQYNYQEKLTHRENMEVLCACLESILDIGNLSDFTSYLA